MYVCDTLARCEEVATAEKVLKKVYKYAVAIFLLQNYKSMYSN